MFDFSKTDNEKLEKILFAATYVFSQFGYEKASIADIAFKAGISKSLIFYYFENKRNLYMSVLSYYNNLVSKKIKDNTDYYETDFFNKAESILRIIIDLESIYPYVFDFLRSIYHENTAEIFGEFAMINEKLCDTELYPIFHNSDHSKFRADVDPSLILKIVFWCIDGFIKDLRKQNIVRIDTVCDEFNTKYLELLRYCTYIKL